MLSAAPLKLQDPCLRLDLRRLLEAKGLPQAPQRVRMEPLSAAMHWRPEAGRFRHWRRSSWEVSWGDLSAGTGGASRGYGLFGLPNVSEAPALHHPRFTPSWRYRVE